jgi:hypothetical protein
MQRDDVALLKECVKVNILQAIQFSKLSIGIQVVAE